MSLDEIFKGVDAGLLFDTKFSNIGFERMTREEIFAFIERSNKKYPAKYIANLRKMSEGMEDGYICTVNNFTIIAWTSWMPSKKRFKKRDKMWVLILDPRNADPFFAIPMNRTGDFIDRLVNTARVYKEKVLQWPHCEECKKMLFWEEIFTYSKDQAEIANDQFPLRYVVCRNPTCDKSHEKSTMFVSDIVLPDKEDDAFFNAPFKRYAKERARNIAKNIFTIPRRLWNWLHKHGIVVHRRRPYNDLENELIGKLRKYPDYADLQYENLPGNYIDVSPSPIQ